MQNYILQKPSHKDTGQSKTNLILGNKKIPIVSPLLVNGELISDFKQTCCIFSNHFYSQCTALKNDGKLSNFSYKTWKRLTSFDIKGADILSIIKNKKCKCGWSSRIWSFVNKNY